MVSAGAMDGASARGEKLQTNVYLSEMNYCTRSIICLFIANVLYAFGIVGFAGALAGWEEGGLRMTVRNSRTPKLPQPG